jgi:hypothetical protein
MIRTLSRLSALAALALSLSAAAAARQAAAPASGNLALQVVYFEGAPTAFQLVSRGPEMAWSWFGHFRTIPRPAATAQAPPVQAVKVSSRAEGAGVRIVVTVFMGEQHFDREEPVGTYAAGVGEEVVVRELERFGVAPFRITPRRVGLNPAAPPVVVNKTQSIEAAVAGFEGVTAKLSLRNLSAKRVQAVEYRETREGRTVWTRFATEGEGRPLIEPGGEYAYGIPRARRGQVSPDGLYIPEAPESILIASAVFEDGTYEGEALTAARLAAKYEGERLQLARSLPLLRQAAAQPGAAARLRAQVGALGIEAPPAAVESILKRYPGLDAPGRDFVKVVMEVSLHVLRQELLDELAGLEKEAAGGGRLGGWLAAKREKFEGWLSRLPPAKN